MSDLTLDSLPPDIAEGHERHNQGSDDNQHSNRFGMFFIEDKRRAEVRVVQIHTPRDQEGQRYAGTAEHKAHDRG